MNDRSATRTEALMGTLVTIEVLQPDADAAIEQAFHWFRHIEACCTRFDEHSELMQLTAQAGGPVPVSAVLYEAVDFAIKVAEETGGAFDPTLGHRMAARGFNREHRTGRAVPALLSPDDDVSYRDVVLDEEHRTITLKRPLVLDLGAVAKGLAVDAAAHELLPFTNFAINAGGDLYMGGHNTRDESWSVGIRHPRKDGELIDTLRVTNCAVCTSGDYERPSHILDPRSGGPAGLVASATVLAPSTMLADALATAAFVLGPVEGIRLFERLGVEGLIFTPELERFQTWNLGHE